MIRHGPRRLDAEATPLRPTIPLAVRIGSNVPMAKIRDAGTRQHCGIDRQGRALTIGVSRLTTVSSRRQPHQNPKSP